LSIPSLTLWAGQYSRERQRPFLSIPSLTLWAGRVSATGLFFFAEATARARTSTTAHARGRLPNHVHHLRIPPPRRRPRFLNAQWWDPRAERAAPSSRGVTPEVRSGLVVRSGATYRARRDGRCRAPQVLPSIRGARSHGARSLRRKRGCDGRTNDGGFQSVCDACASGRGMDIARDTCVDAAREYATAVPAGRGRSGRAVRACSPGGADGAVSLMCGEGLASIPSLTLRAVGLSGSWPF